MNKIINVNQSEKIKMTKPKVTFYNVPLNIEDHYKQVLEVLSVKEKHNFEYEMWDAFTKIAAKYVDYDWKS